MNDELDLFSRALVGLVFLLAGATKVFRPTSELRRSIEAYQLVPQPIVRVLAVTLPWLELLIGTALLTGAARRVPAAIATALLAGFSGAVAFNLLRGRSDISCGCFGSLAADTKLSWGIVVRNVMLAVLSATAAFAKPVDAVSPPEAIVIFLLAAGVLLAVIVAQTITRMGQTAPRATSSGRPGSAARSRPTSSNVLSIRIGREPRT